MAIVQVEYNSKNWCDETTGEERDATIDEIIAVFQQFSVATKCPITMSPKNSLRYWYCEFEVEPERVKAFMSIFDWTMDFQASLNVEVR